MDQSVLPSVRRKFPTMEEIDEQFARAARLLEPHIGSSAAAELRERALSQYIANFRWKWDTRRCVEKVAAELGQDHPALVIINALLNLPMPVFMDESPDDPEDDELEDDDQPEDSEKPEEPVYGMDDLFGKH